MTVSNLTITGTGHTIPFGLNEDGTYTRSAASTGGGGWQLVDHPRRKVSTEWVDVGDYQLTLNLIMDSMLGPHAQQSIEGNISVVEAWETAAPGSNPPLPPRVTIAGPVAHTELPWVVYTLNWGAAIRDTAGHRIYQELQLVLLEYAPSTINSSSRSPAQAAQQSSSTTATRRYTVRAGDTLITIAAKQLGDWKLWPQIASLNKIRDPNRITVGQVLALPAL